MFLLKKAKSMMLVLLCMQIHTTVLRNIKPVPLLRPPILIPTSHFIVLESRYLDQFTIKTTLCCPLRWFYNQNFTVHASIK